MTSTLLRLVLDTSVIISAFRSRHGASALLLKFLIQRRFTAVATPTLLFEYEAVLGRPEQRQANLLSDHRLEEAMQALAALIEPVRVDYQWRPQLTDPDDELVLEAAINGSAYAIVTHNVRHFETAAKRFNIRVVPPGVYHSGEVSLMPATTTPVHLPESVVRAAEVQARLRGVSLEAWVSRAVAERLDTTEGAQEFFRRRATGATGEALKRILDTAPDVPPMLGDELPDGYISPRRP